MKKIVLITILLVAITGCGHSSHRGSGLNDNNGTSPITPTPSPSDSPTEVITMTIDEPYQVYKYDEINKTSNEAQVEIVHFEDGNTAAILRVGSATLTRY